VIRRPEPARALLATLLVVALAACAPGARGPAEVVEGEIVAATPIADVLAPRFELLAEGTRIERFDPPGAGAGLGVAIATRLRNPNDFAVTIERIEYVLTLAGIPVARGELAPGLVIEPNGDALLDWGIDAPLSERRELWRPVVDTFVGEPLPFALEGIVRFTSQSYAFTTGTRPLVEGTLLADQAIAPPRLRLDGTASRVTLVRADAPVVSLSLLVSNPGDIGYFLSGSALELEVNDAVVAWADLGPVPVPAGETRRVELIFIVELGRLSPEALEALAEALRGERAVVRVQGGFAYDVLGVDSYRADIGGGLVTSLPPSRLPGGTAPTHGADD
jgi:hypothetical protein